MTHDELVEQSLLIYGAWREEKMPYIHEFSFKPMAIESLTKVAEAVQQIPNPYEDGNPKTEDECLWSDCIECFRQKVINLLKGTERGKER